MCPGMFQNVEDYIRRCEVCRKNKLTGPYVKAPFQEMDTQYQPWDKIIWILWDLNQ